MPVLNIHNIVYGVAWSKTNGNAEYIKWTIQTHKTVLPVSKLCAEVHTKENAYQITFKYIVFEMPVIYKYHESSG